MKFVVLLDTNVFGFCLLPHSRKTYNVPEQLTILKKPSLAILISVSRKGSPRRVAMSLQKCGNFVGEFLPDGSLKNGLVRQAVL